MESKIHPEHKEAINVIRTIREMVNRDFNDERFKKHVLSLLHSTARGCIGCDKDIPEEIVKYELPKEWDKFPKKYIHLDGKKYELTDVELECKTYNGITSCHCCDLREPCHSGLAFVCGIYKCFKLVKVDKNG